MAKGLFRNLDSRRPATEPSAAPADVAVAPRKAALAPSRQGKRALTVYVTPETWRELRQIGLDEGATMQALVGEALDLLARSRGKHPFGEK